jgi:hypothetical protein
MGASCSQATTYTKEYMSKSANLYNQCAMPRHHEVTIPDEARETRRTLLASCSCDLAGPSNDTAVVPIQLPHRGCLPPLECSKRRECTGRRCVREAHTPGPATEVSLCHSRPKPGIVTGSRRGERWLVGMQGALCLGGVAEPRLDSAQDL